VPLAITENCRSLKVASAVIETRLIALIEEAGVITRILRHLGRPTEIPAPRPARAPPRLVGVPGAADWDAAPSMFAPCS
jgi:hypothetical protein